MSRMLEIDAKEKLTLVPSSFRELPKRGDDPLADLLTEFDDYDMPEEEQEAPVVTPPTIKAHQREDQMLVTLNGQLSALREGIQRMRFYLSDVDNSLQR